MKKICVFYGSTTGTTETVANLVAEKLGVDAANVMDVSSMDADTIAGCDVLVFGGAGRSVSGPAGDL